MTARRYPIPVGATVDQCLDALSVPEPNSGCTLWLGSMTPAGYGQLSFNGVQEYAHRLAYMGQVGPIPKGLHLDHLCRNRGCINVRHLEVVTPRENARRGAPAQKKECLRGHPFSDENTHITKNGHRICRACRRQHVKAHYQKVRPSRRTYGQSLTRSLTMAVSDDLYAWLKEEADRRGLSAGAIVREIVQQAMSAEQTAQRREGAA